MTFTAAMFTSDVEERLRSRMDAPDKRDDAIISLSAKLMAAAARERYWATEAESIRLTLESERAIAGSQQICAENDRDAMRYERDAARAAASQWTVEVKRVQRLLDAQITERDTLRGELDQARAEVKRLDASMTNAEILSRCIANDELNLADAECSAVMNQPLVRQVTTDCAIRFVEAGVYGDQFLKDLAEQNLKRAVVLATYTYSGYVAIRRDG